MLSYDTYTQLGFKALTQEQFEKQVAIAQTLVENITNQFYAAYYRARFTKHG